jgi:hypothetical protein
MLYCLVNGCSRAVWQFTEDRRRTCVEFGLTLGRQVSWAREEFQDLWQVSYVEGAAALSSQDTSYFPRFQPECRVRVLLSWRIHLVALVDKCGRCRYYHFRPLYICFNPSDCASQLLLKENGSHCTKRLESKLGASTDVGLRVHVGVTHVRGTDPPGFHGRRPGGRGRVWRRR